MVNVAWIRWEIDDDGRGTAWVFAPVEGGNWIDGTRYVFNSLDELPVDLARVIREDGRSTGKADLR